MRTDAPIGVFDSGCGGLSVLKALRAELPHEDFVYYADAGHAPYGERGDDHVAQRTRAVARTLREDHGVKALVVACNTATAAAIHLARADHEGFPVVGVEPALKPAAALTRTGKIAVLATRGTLASAKLAALHASLKARAEFVLVPCDGLAAAIDLDDTARIQALCEQYLRQAGPFGQAPGQADTLVLGCTHYPFAWEQFARGVGPAVTIVETGAPVARQTRRLLEAAGALRGEGGSGQVRLASSGDPQALQAAARRWLGL